jgi:hypothetical protein
MTKIKVYFPWAETPIGGSFFIPTIAPFKTKEAGLIEALRLHMKAKATFGLLNGRHGVLFTRRS